MEDVYDFSNEPHPGVWKSDKDFIILPNEEYKKSFYVENDQRIFCIRNSKDQVIFFGKDQVYLKKFVGSNILVWFDNPNEGNIQLFLMDLQKLEAYADPETVFRIFRMNLQDESMAIKSFNSVSQLPIPKSYEGSYDLPIPPEMRQLYL